MRIYEGVFANAYLQMRFRECVLVISRSLTSQPCRRDTHDVVQTRTRSNGKTVTSTPGE